MASGTNRGFLHAAFGLRLRSAIDLPELARLADDGSAADVAIERGRVPRRLAGATDVRPAMQVAGRRFQLDVPASRFAVNEGSRILVDARQGVPDADLRPYLLGTVMGALCLQRGLLPLHAAAVVVDGGAVAFAGPTGVGKSTLAGWFLAGGWQVLADDLLAVATGPDGTPLALPGLARIRLGRNAADPGGPKVSLPVPAPDPVGAWPLRRLYILRAEGVDPPRIARLHGPEAAAGALGQVHRRPLAVAMGGEAACFAHCVALARRSEVFAVEFSHGGADPLALARILKAHLAA